MIILDWDKNSEEVLAQGHYNTKRSVNAEQTHLCRYWQEQGVDKEAAYQTWVALESPQAVGCFEEEERREYFEKFWAAAEEAGPNEKYAYGLTQKEYSFINELDVDVEYKNFLRSLVEYCRTYGKDGAFFCKQPTYAALAKGVRHHLTEARELKMAQWNQKYDLYRTTVFCGYTHKNTTCRIDLRFFDNSGAELIDKPFGEQMTECPCCKKNFILPKTAKTPLCPECYHYLRTESRNGNYYKSHPNVNKNPNKPTFF